MALGTYAELQAHIADDLNRTDLTTQIRDFIVMAEAELSDRLRCREMDVRATLTITDGEAAIPPTLQSVRAMRLADTPYSRIEPEGLEALESRNPTGPGPIQTYALTADNFVFWPPLSGSARVTYRRNVPALTNSATSNWLLAKYPQLYVHGALWYAYAFLKDEQRAAYQKTEFIAKIETVNDSDKMAQISGMNVNPGTQVV